MVQPVQPIVDRMDRRTLGSKSDMKVGREMNVARRIIQPCEKYRLNVSVLNVITCLMLLCVRWHESDHQSLWALLCSGNGEKNSACELLFPRIVSCGYHFVVFNQSMKGIYNVDA